jgi:hypothetical protein
LEREVEGIEEFEARVIQSKFEFQVFLLAINPTNVGFFLYLEIIDDNYHLNF